MASRSLSVLFFRRTAAAVGVALACACSSSSSSPATATRDAGCPAAPAQGEPCVASASCNPQQGGGCDVVFWMCIDGAWSAAHPPGCHMLTDAAAGDAGEGEDAAVDAGCVENPLDGQPCNPAVPTCTPAPACGEHFVCNPVDGGGVWQSYTSNCVTEDAGMPKADGGPPKGHLDGSVAASSCSKCGANELCVVDIQVGGAAATRGDGGAIICHNGGSGPNCTHQSFACANLPESCGARPTCACAAQLCAASYACTDGDSGLYSAGGPGPILVCQQDDP